MTLAKAGSAVAVLCLIGTIACAWQTPGEAQAAEKTITSTLHQMYEAEKRRDLKFVLAHLADDFAEVGGDGGVYHRADIEAGWADVKLNDYELSACIFKLASHDAAYLSCKMSVNATYKGAALPRNMRVTTLWTRASGQWLIRFEQATIIPEASKRD